MWRIAMSVLVCLLAVLTYTARAQNVEVECFFNQPLCGGESNVTSNVTSYEDCCAQENASSTYYRFEFADCSPCGPVIIEDQFIPFSQLPEDLGTIILSWKEHPNAMPANEFIVAYQLDGEDIGFLYRSDDGLNQVQLHGLIPGELQIFTLGARRRVNRLTTLRGPIVTVELVVGASPFPVFADFSIIEFDEDGGTFVKLSFVLISPGIRDLESIIIEWAEATEDPVYDPEDRVIIDDETDLRNTTFVVCITNLEADVEYVVRVTGSNSLAFGNSTLFVGVISLVRELNEVDVGLIRVSSSDRNLPSLLALTPALLSVFYLVGKIY